MANNIKSKCLVSMAPGGALLLTFSACSLQPPPAQDPVVSVSRALCTVEDCPNPPADLCASYCTASTSCSTPCTLATWAQTTCGAVHMCNCSGSLTASQTSILGGGSSQLAWSASDGCTGAVTLDDRRVLRSGTAFVTPSPGSHTYYLRNDATVLAGATVSVGAHPGMTPTTLTQTIYRASASGYSALNQGGGEGRTVRPLIGSPSGIGVQRPLLAFVHLTDLHVVDDQSPLRVPYLDHYADYVAPGDNNNWDTNSAYFPHEVLTSQLSDAMARAIRYVGAAPATGLAPSFTILTGDGVDNTQYNETRSYIDALDGKLVRPNSHPNGWDEGLGKTNAIWPNVPYYYWHAESGFDEYNNPIYDEYTGAGFPHMPGLYAAARAPFVATGLGMPWYASMGNHDVAVQGNMPIDYLDHWYNPYKTAREIATGSERITDVDGLPNDGHDLGAILGITDVLGSILSLSLPIHTNYATANPDRRPLSRSEFVAEHYSTVGAPAGHGFTQGSDHGYYSFSSGPADMFELISLDSNNTEHTGPNGWIDNAQFTWLENQLKANSSRYRADYDTGNFVYQAGVKDRLIVVYCHHPIESMDNISYDYVNNTMTPRGHTGTELEHLLLRFPNVVLMAVGHVHTNRITAHSRQFAGGNNGFWEIATTAVSDWPNQSRLVEFAVNDGLTPPTLSILTTMIDIDANAPMDTQPAASDGSPRNLAAIARVLAANDPQALGADSKAGTTADRNTELQLPAPFTVPFFCGDGVCNTPETTSSCPVDCQSLFENFNELTVPALPPGWVSTPPGGSGWVSASLDMGGQNAAFTNDPPSVSDKTLDSRAFTPAAQTRLTFRHSLALETGYDGAVLEISLNGAPFVDIVSAGGRFVTGDYNPQPISTWYGSPIAGRRAWTGNSGGFQNVMVDLPPASIQVSTRLRWRVASDSSVAVTGYYLDDVHILGVAGCLDANACNGRCGSIVNACGVTVDCGGCAWPQSCGGGGTPNACGCTPNSNPCPFTQCGGTASDGCGGQVACHADCSLNGLCSCRGGSCSLDFCNCSTGPCL